MPKPPLLLLHGAIGSAKQFEPLTPLLADSFEIHAPDLPGHGQKSNADSPFSIAGFAGFVREYIETHHLHSASVFGYSMGGYIALHLAAHHPECIRRIFTLATKFNWTPETAERESSQLNPAKILEKVPAFASSLEQVHGAAWKSVLEKTAAMLLAMGQHSPLNEDMLRSISIPVCIGIGELDKMVSREESDYAASKLQKGELHLFRATPHPLEKTDMRLVAEKIISFIL